MGVASLSGGARELAQSLLTWLILITNSLFSYPHYPWSSIKEIPWIAFSKVIALRIRIRWNEALRHFLSTPPWRAPRIFWYSRRGLSISSFQQQSEKSDRVYLSILAFNGSNRSQQCCIKEYEATHPASCAHRRDETTRTKMRQCSSTSFISKQNSILSLGNKAGCLLLWWHSNRVQLQTNDIRLELTVGIYQQSLLFIEVGVQLYSPLALSHL